MKRISIIIVLLLSVFLTSCTRIKTTDSAKEFCEYIYDISSGKIERGAVIDLRVLDADYAAGHIFGALSYDFNNQSKDHFINWITGLKHQDTTILLIDYGKGEHEIIMDYLKEAGYKKVIAYTKGYDALKETNEFKIMVEVKTGTDDCGC